MNLLSTPSADTYNDRIKVRYENGYRIARDFLPEWGLLVDEDYEYKRSLEEQVAAEIGPGEAVEYTEVWELIMAVAQAAYEEGKKA